MIIDVSHDVENYIGNFSEMLDIRTTEFNLKETTISKMYNDLNDVNFSSEFRYKTSELSKYNLDDIANSNN